LLDNDEPMTYTEGMVGPNSEKWLRAMESEIESMHDNQVWNLVDPINRVRPISCKRVIKKKTDKDETVHIYKARLVAKGFKEIHGIDYDETLTPIVMLKFVQILLAIAAHLIMRYGRWIVTSHPYARMVSPNQDLYELSTPKH
jgi:hypothetical protein